MTVPVASITGSAGELTHTPDQTGDWVLHVDEPTRVLARAVVSGVATSLGGVGELVWTPAPIWSSSQVGIESRVPRAVTLQGRRREAHFVIYRDNLTLTVSGRGREDYALPFWIGGSLVDGGDRIAPMARVITTLEYWQHGLTRPVSEHSAAEAQGYVTALRRLGLGVVAASGLDWLNFSVEPGNDGVHAIHVWSEKLGSLRYSSADGAATERRLSPALVDAIDRIVGGRIHVSEGYARAPDELPGLMIDFIGHVFLHHDDKPDADSIARAISDLPSGAMLIGVDVNADLTPAVVAVTSSPPF